MNQSTNLLFVMGVFQTSIVNFLVKVSNLQFGLENTRKFMRQTISAKGLWRKGEKIPIFSKGHHLCCPPSYGEPGGSVKSDMYKLVP